MVLVFVAGCGEVHGLSLAVGSFERGLWADSDKKNVEGKPGWGLKLDLNIGQWLRPVGSKDGGNPWQGGEPAFVMRSGIPLPNIFIGVHIGDYGLYLGGKTYLVEERHCTDQRYGAWIKEEECPCAGKVKTYIAPSASFRRTRWK